jgi:geranylgeranyl diphosphate synthase type II
MGGVAGNAEASQLRSLSEYGLKIGLGFQVADDILDVSATTDQLGKTAGKDEKAGKVTYPSVVGMDESKAHCQKLADEAIKALAPFGDKAQILSRLASALVERKK